MSRNDRRLNTLNKCASMKLDVNFQRKKCGSSSGRSIRLPILTIRCTASQKKMPNTNDGDDSDEEDLCISNKWTFQRTSRRWSRVDDLYTLFPRGDRNGSPGGTGMRNTTSSESVLTDLSEPEVCSIHSESSGGSDGRSQPGQCHTDSPVMLDAPLVSSSLPQSPRDVLSHPFHPKNEKPTRARAKSFLKRMETLRGKGTHGRHKGSGRTGGLVISGPVLQQEPESFKAVQCIQIPNGDLQNSPPTACRKGLPCSGKSSGESSPSEHSSSGVSTPCLKERKCHEANKRGGMYLEDLDVLAGTALRDAGDQSRTHEFHSQENLVVHIPKDHKPGTFPKALSIESLSPTDSSNGVNWRTGSISLGRQQVPGAREPRLMASCHRASRVSIYDNVPDSHLYASTGDLLDLEKDDFLPHLDDILQHVNGIREVVDDWSKDVLPELQTRDTLVGEPGLSPFPPPNQITLDFEGNSVSEGRTTPSDVERDVTSLNESEAPGVRDRRDSGVGASLTRPNR
ncbi:StAR- lipid transfer protein 13 [Saguinus oedipus]|uniref:StAR- lipid transfer protein 13 n=1 Tax=Saguinus oedipus TaxID=9490 RepID=A0ABQ9VU87_SAGOE|nr:StAR- lipid transfer protein 13 [Saguinus oedipus]